MAPGQGTPPQTCVTTISCVGISLHVPSFLSLIGIPLRKEIDRLGVEAYATATHYEIIS
jgi:hypothetical protein